MIEVVKSMDGIDLEVTGQQLIIAQNNATMGISQITRIVKMETLMCMMDVIQIDK